MYRISKVLNHNGVIVIDLNDQKEYVLLGKGAGFGRKIGERMEKPETCTVYSLQETSSKGDASDLIKSVAPEYFQMANQILNHLAFAVERIKRGKQISNPLTEDIQALILQ